MPKVRSVAAIALYCITNSLLHTNSQSKNSWNDWLSSYAKCCSNQIIDHITMSERDSVAAVALYHIINSLLHTNSRNINSRNDWLSMLQLSRHRIIMPKTTMQLHAVR